MTTCAAVVVLGMFDGCAVVADVFTGGGATIRMQPVRMESASCDTRLGESLLQTLPSVAPPESGVRRVLVIGNSQQYTASLPRGAQPDLERQAEMASSLVAQSLAERQADKLSFYTAAAPNQNFVEALWQGIYWFNVSPRGPSTLVVQASFDTFRKTGVRSGFATLLDDESFAAALTQYTRDNPSRAWSSDFVEATQAHASRQAEADQPRRPTLESKLRRALEAIPLFARREERRSSFLTALYMVRVHVLGISPTTKRHIAGQPLEQNLQALEDLVKLARADGCEVLVYNAPTNPAVSMFFENEYDDYLLRVAREVRQSGGEFVDLRDAVEPANWGYWIDGPDPIHFDEHGHGQLAARLTQELIPILARPAQ